MSKKNILIVDDEMDVEKSWRHQLEEIQSVTEQFEVSCIKPDEFETSMERLEKRRGEARNGKYETNSDEKLDSVDILIVDYDLLMFNQTSYITGEEFAYLARCYSRCGIIITLNQFGTNRFDLSLMGNLDSFADLNIGSLQIGNTGLWSENKTRFRPWSWEILPDFCERYKSIIDSLLDKDEAGKSNLDQPILKYFKISDEISEYLSPSVKTFISKKEEISEVTFRNFVLESDNGLRRKDKAIDDEQIARIAAARIHKWFERRLLAGQDFLVDAAHLITRFPSLISGDLTQVESWNAATCFGDYSECGIKHEIISDYEFPYRDWLSRPAWFWRSVRECEEIEEVKDPWNSVSKYPEYVFAEDISAFIPLEGAKEFYADLPSSFIQRYVVDQESEIGKEYVDELDNVDYEPKLRFVL